MNTETLLLRIAAFCALLLCSIGLQLMMVGMATNEIFYHTFATYTFIGWVAQILWWVISICMSATVAVSID